MAGGDFQPLDDFLEDGLDLPVRGKDGEVRTYHIADPSAEAGVKIERITSYAARLAAGGTKPGTKVLDDDEEIDLYRLCLGDSYERLLAELSWSMFKHVALTTMFWVTTDRETAMEYWHTRQHPGKAPRNRAERRQVKRDTSASDGANTTQSPASTSGTRAGSRRRGGRGRGRSRT